MELSEIKQKIEGVVEKNNTISICEQFTKEFIDKIEIKEISGLLKQIRKRKISSVHNQNFAQARNLRDIELCIEKKISFYLFGHFTHHCIKVVTCNNCTNIYEIDKEQKISEISCPICNSTDFRLNFSKTTDDDVSI